MWLVVGCDVLGFCGYVFFFFQAEDGIRDLVRSRGLGDVYKRQVPTGCGPAGCPQPGASASGCRGQERGKSRRGSDLSLIHI